MNIRTISVGFLLILLHSVHVVAFSYRQFPSRSQQRSRLLSSTEASVDRLLKLVRATNQDISSIREAIHEVVESESNQLEENTSFDPLIGNYDVSCTIPVKPTERPVGGKWNNSFFSIEKTWQHVLPSTISRSVAEVVNVIVLSALFWRVYVILRGDAYVLGQTQREEIVSKQGSPGGLSSRTVKVDFDPPRIGVVAGGGAQQIKRVLLSLSLGPTSSVVLDTPYCDEKIRIGKGSRGSSFVFLRTNDPLADSWKLVLNVKPLRKRTLVGMLAATSALGLSLAARLKGYARWASLAIGVPALFCGVLSVFSTGGIVQDRTRSAAS